MMRRAPVLSLVLALAAGCVLARGGGVSAAPPPGMIAQDLAELVRTTPLIVVGKVLDLRPGRVAGTGQARLQFNDVRVAVERRLKGESDDPVIVEQVDLANRQVLSPEVGPAYKAGERYVLFLMPGEGARKVTGPQHRYLIQGGTIRPLGIGPVADPLKGADAAKFVEQVATLARAQ